MSDRKITVLPSLTAVDIAQNDLFHVVNISEQAANKNQSMLLSELINAVLPVSISYTPTFSAGFGTVTLDDYHYTNRNGVMNIWGTHTNGTPTATAVTISLPSGFKVSTVYNAVHFLGRLQRNALTPAAYGVIGTAGDTFLEISRMDTGSTLPFVVMLGNGGLGTAEIQGVQVELLVEAV